MLVDRTHIIGIEADLTSVKVTFRAKGSDSADPPVSVRLTPHATNIHLNLNYAEFNCGSNVKTLEIKPVS